MSPTFDVAIVGGGPAGASTALFLAREQGIHPSRVVILDKANFPREKPCAGAISACGIRALAGIDVHVDVPRVAMRGLRVIEGKNVQDARVDDLGIVVRREEFDCALLRTAEASGVVVREGAALVGLAKGSTAWSLETRSADGTAGEVRARVLVAADGAGSVTRRLLGIAEAERKGHLYVLETDERDGDLGPRDGLCDFDLGPCSRGICGYYWDFPTVIGGVRAVSRGIYHANFAPGRDLKGALAESLSARGIDIRAVRLKPFPARPYVARSQAGGPGFLLVGEACGIDATTGEGIAQAILMARIAARHLAFGLRAGDLDARAYGDEVRGSRMGRHLLQSAWFASRVYGPRGAHYRRFLARSRGACEAGARWYRGEPLGLATKARLLSGLLTELVTDRRSSARA